MQFNGLKLFGILSILAISTYTAQPSMAMSHHCHGRKGHVHCCKSRANECYCHTNLRKFTTLMHESSMCHKLACKGPYTIFAPTDAAFAKLPKGSFEALQKDKKQLNKVLAYHMVPGRHKISDIAALRSLKTLEGESLMVNAKGSTVLVDGAIVTKPDIECHKGYIQAIDTVLMPERGK